jgi:hypothetical protein
MLRRTSKVAILSPMTYVAAHVGRPQVIPRTKEGVIGNAAQVMNRPGLTCATMCHNLASHGMQEVWHDLSL